MFEEGVNSQVPTRCVLFAFVSVPSLGFRSLGSLGLRACGGAGFKGLLGSGTWRSKGLGFRGYE